MAGYWPSSFFACLLAETESRSTNTQKKTEAADLFLKSECKCVRIFVLFVYQVKVTKAKQTLTAPFDQAIRKFSLDGEWPWYSGKS